MNLGYHDQSYIDAFNLIMALNPCPTMQDLKVVSTGTCKNFSDGIVAQGMAVALAKHFENIRRILEIFTNINNKTFMAKNTSEYVAFYNISQNATYNNIINLFNSNLKIQTSYLFKFLSTFSLFFRNHAEYLCQEFFKVFD